MSFSFDSGFCMLIPECRWKDHEEFEIIPSWFESNYGVTLSNPVYLGLPNGLKWKISWIRQNGGIWFKEGWNRFMHDWSLSYPDFLVFKYEGDSHFTVRKFRVTKSDPFHACDIDYSNIKCTNDNNDEVESDDCVEIPKSEIDTQFCKKRRTDTKRERKTKDADLSQRRKKPNKTKINVGFDATRQRSSGNSLFAYAGTSRECSKAEAIILKQKVSALQRATKFKTRIKNPSFICTLRPSYIRSDSLVIPREFSKKYLNSFEGTATIGVCEDMTRLVKIKFNKSNNQSSITKGWISFPQEYKLEVDDVCLFERIKCTPLSFQIIIFRNREDPEKLQGYGHDEAHWQIQDKRQRRPIQNMERGKRNRSEEISRSCPITDLLGLGDSESPNMNMNENKFKFLIKSNHLKKAYAYIPMAFLRKHPRCHGKYVTLQVGEMSWLVKVSHYPGRQSFGRFSGGWIAFARECKLKVGNICEFDLIDEEKLVFKVSISRHSH